MKTARALPALLMISWLAPQLVSAQSATSAAEIASHCDRLDGLSSAGGLPVRIFADLSSGTKGPAHWKEFVTDEARAGQDDGTNLNQNAYIWLEDKRPVFASFLFQSGSRTWAHYVSYCFRADGSLARTSAELKTLQGRIRAVRTTTYDAARKELSRSEQLFDLDSGEPAAEGRTFTDESAPAIWSTSEFPFGDLLSKPQGAAD